MTLLQRYRQAEAELAALLERQRRLEEDPLLQRDLEFERRLLQLLVEYKIDRVEALAIIRTARLEQRQPLAIRYRHPRTGEILEDTGFSATRLMAWRLQYGEATVTSWKIRSEMQEPCAGTADLLVRPAPHGAERCIPFTSV